MRVVNSFFLRDYALLSTKIESFPTTHSPTNVGQSQNMEVPRRGALKLFFRRKTILRSSRISQNNRLSRTGKILRFIQPLILIRGNIGVERNDSWETSLSWDFHEWEWFVITCTTQSIDCVWFLGDSRKLSTYITHMWDIFNAHQSHSKSTYPNKKKFKR